MTMQRIYLNKNQLTYLPPSTFDSFDMNTLENVDISDNRWHCVCGKEWLVDWLDALGDRDDMEGVLGCLANSNCGLIATKKKEDEESAARRSALISVGASLLALASILILMMIAYMFVSEGKHTVGIAVRPIKIIII